MIGVTHIATLGSGPAGPIEAYLAGELVAKPLLFVGNILATEATAYTMISESITGDLGANITVQSAQNGFSVIGNLSIGSGSAVGLTTTLGGWVPIVPSWGSLALQTLTVANDFGLLGVTKKEIPIRFSTFVSE